MGNDEKWIITPGLEPLIDKFIQLYEIIFHQNPKKKPIILLGDTGTGKTLFWNLFKALSESDYKKTSANSQMPFMRFNCAAIHKDLILSELFGTDEGAYTGAIYREGLVETA